jgi:hypothetical protein
MPRIFFRARCAGEKEHLTVFPLSRFCSCRNGHKYQLFAQLLRRLRARGQGLRRFFSIAENERFAVR